MITTELYTLNITEDPTVLIPHIQALYRQAGISADPASALANVQQIAQDPQARAALQAMKAAYPSTGSPDLNEDAIKLVYANSIRAASDETQVPPDILAKVISAESKGHPFVCNGLTQMDYVAWGQMVDSNSQLENRYLPASNIMAAAMYLARAKQQYGCAWDSCYYNHYRDPSLKMRN